ncbi:MAG TPA: ATP synthase F1 subunit epsilon [Gemmataceae bacterium]|nr:ATP synthase F1 subunit epsilon [Gemmataceae bacterium]
MVEANERELHCVVVTPERALLDEPADYVVLPMYDGELGVLPGRLPLIGRLGYGELRLRRGGQVRRYFIDGGFAQVRANTVTVLTPRAMPAEAINTTAATEALEAALRPTSTAEAMEAQLKAQERARAQLRVAHHGEAAGH